jgi:hypothetical protein
MSTTSTDSSNLPVYASATMPHPPQTISQPTVIELFQSQGCNSCPPTNANLLSIDDPNTLILSYHVTYWNHLGWRDTFGNPTFDNRQRDYVKRLRLRSAFTPQVIVNGRASGVGNTAQGLEKVIRDGSQGRGGADVRLHVEENPDGGDAVVRVLARDFAFGHGLELWLVRYNPEIKHVNIKSGENHGRVLPHRNVVVSLERIGDITLLGESVWKVRRDHRGLKSVVLVQAGSGGPIVGAASL